MKACRVALLLAILAAPALPVLAVVVHAPVWQASYVAAFQPTFGRQGVPYSGDMDLKFNHGIITGTYNSTSVRPDPLRGRIVPVSGNVSHGNITLILQGANGFTVRGTLGDDATISGTATIRGSFYSFLAKVRS